MLIVFIALYTLLHVYIYTRIAAALALNFWQKGALWLVFAVMIVFPLLARALEHRGRERAARVVAWTGYLWMGAAFIFAVVSFVTDTSWHLIGTLIAVPHARGLGLPAPFLFSVALTAMLVSYAFVERSHIRIEKLILFTPKPVGRTGGVRIAQISDVHIGLMSGRRRVRRVVKLLTRCNPDMVVSTGDLLDAQLKAEDDFAREFTTLNPPLGKFAVLGNHECYVGLEASARFIEKSGFELLRNRVRRVGGLTIMGLDDPAAGATVDDERALFAAPGSAFVLLLKHRPEMLPGSSRHVDLQLSGHTHRGQIFPFSLLTRLRYHRHAGLFRIGEAFLYVSRGTGSWGPPLRLFAPPEITLIEIRTRPEMEQAEALPKPC
ncbi:MAG: metallophosphoesterase [Acidiferrobacteraceae bacterium]